MFRFDMFKYAGDAVVGYGALLAYDCLVEGKNIRDSLVMKDALVFGLSNVASTLAFDVVSGMLPYLNEGSIGGMISKPLLNGIVYMWLYDYMISGKYNNTRENTSTFMVGAGLSLVSSYLQNPLLSLFGLKNY